MKPGKKKPLLIFDLAIQQEIINLLVEGINEGKTKDIPVMILQKEKEAIQYAYDNVKPGAIITIMCDVIPDALEYIKKLKEDEDKENEVVIDSNS